MKAIDYRKGMTHKDVREAINANTERANANFAEMGKRTSVPYVVTVRKYNDLNSNYNIIVETDREIEDGDKLKIMRYVKRNRKWKGDEGQISVSKWNVAFPNSQYNGYNFFNHPIGWIDFSKSYFKLIGGGRRTLQISVYGARRRACLFRLVSL